MKEVDYHKTVETFDHHGRKFMAIDACDLCDMKDDCYNPTLMSCTPELRDDKRYVIYKEVDLRKRWMRNLVFILAVLLCSLFISAVVVLFLDSNYLLAALMVVAGLFMVVDAIYNKYGRR